MARDITSGIYKITCISNGKVYIGMSNDIHKRWWEHKSNGNAVDTKGEIKGGS